MANSKNNGNKSSGEDLLTVKEVSSKLDISEATVRKYLKEFDLEFEKGNGSKAVISEITLQALLEIVKLRANGLSIQEIKELKSQEPSKHILDQIEEDKPKEEIPKELTASVIEDKEDLSQTDEDVVVDEPQEQLNVLEIEEEEEQQPDEDLPKRRRLFNYRYVERQISNDSKRVRSLRQRLRNTNLLVHDRLFIEEALERRILFLEGWKHILKWISTK